MLAPPPPVAPLTSPTHTAIPAIPEGEVTMNLPQGYPQAVATFAPSKPPFPLLQDDELIAP
jgi:hypothetical protein